MTITVTVMYPNTPGSKFDMEYYMGSHFDLVGKLWGPKLKSARVIKGVATPDPDTPPPFQVIAILEFESTEDLQAAMDEHGEEVMGDVPNFTDLTPTVQISENLG